MFVIFFFFFSSRRRHTRLTCDWSSDVCSSDLRDDVLKSTGNRQEPFVYGSLGGNDVPLVPPRAVPAQPAVNPQSEIRRDYELALQVGNKAAMSAFIAQHPDGFYASLAKLQLEKIAAEEAHVAAAEKARLAEQERTRLAA